MIVGILLAAGKSRRMGHNKLSLPVGNETIGSRSLKTAITSSLDKVIVVTKEDDPLNWIPSHFLQDPYKKKWIYISSNKSELGQAESIKCGLIAAQKMQAKAVMVLLADQPFMTKEIINQLISLYMDRQPNYVASSCNGVINPPVLFHSTLFPLLLQLQGDTGARGLLKGDIDGLTVPFANEKEFQDIDTPQQYQAIIAEDATLTRE